MESCVCCGQFVPLLALAIYKEPAVSASSAVGIRPLLLLSICAGTAILGCTSNVWLTVDTLSVKVVESDGPWPREMRSGVAWMVVAAGSFPVAENCWSWDALTRTNEIMVTGSLFPVRFSCKASNNALAMLSGMSASLGVASFSSLPGLGGDVVTC